MGGLIRMYISVEGNVKILKPCLKHVCVYMNICRTSTYIGFSIAFFSVDAWPLVFQLWMANPTHSCHNNFCMICLWHFKFLLHGRSLIWSMVGSLKFQVFLHGRSFSFKKRKKNPLVTMAPTLDQRSELVDWAPKLQHLLGLFAEGQGWQVR